MKVPGGFKIASDSANNVTDGVVIEDSNQNQFVWIPVEKTDQYNRINFGPCGAYNSDSEWNNFFNGLRDGENYLPRGISDEKTAVLNAGGFYIGRFEASSVNGKLQSKKGVLAWYNITHATAIAKAKEFMNNSYAKSALITGRQWDRVMNFVDGKLDGNGARFYVRQNSSTRHKGKTTCGTNLADRVCNIYDLEGNFSEWVTDSQVNGYPAVLRGENGSTNGKGGAAMTWSGFENNPYNTVGFRLMLYV